MFLCKILFYVFILNIFSQNVFSSETCNNVKLENKNVYNESSIRLMQYNMEWVFIDYYKNSDCPGNGCTWLNENDTQKHISYLSNVINKINPDIINICEIEGCNELSKLNNLSNNNYNYYLTKGSDEQTGQNVGMLTKINPDINLYRTNMNKNYPIENSNCNYTGPAGTYGVSKNYITEFTINDVNIAMISVHFLAKPTDSERCAKREAQALVMHDVIKEYIHNNYEVIFIGDLNDYDKDILDINNNIPTSKVLDILKGAYTNDYIIYSVAENIPQHDRFTNWWDSEDNCKNLKQNYAMIDHILVTENLKNKIKDVFIYHGYKEYCGKWDSDHYPIVVDLDFT